MPGARVRATTCTPVSGDWSDLPAAVDAGDDTYASWTSTQRFTTGELLFAGFDWSFIPGDAVVYSWFAEMRYYVSNNSINSISLHGTGGGVLRQVPDIRTSGRSFSGLPDGIEVWFGRGGASEGGTAFIDWVDVTVEYGPPTGSVWNGSVWEPLKVWNGSRWVPGHEARLWNGNSWVQLGKDPVPVLDFQFDVHAALPWYVKNSSNVSIFPEDWTPVVWTGNAVRLTSLPHKTSSAGLSSSRYPITVDRDMEIRLRARVKVEDSLGNEFLLSVSDGVSETDGSMVLTDGMWTVLETGPLPLPEGSSNLSFRCELPDGSAEHVCTVEIDELVLIDDATGDPVMGQVG